MLPSDITSALIVFLQELPLNNKIGNWTYVKKIIKTNSKNGNIYYKSWFDLKGTKYEFKIWFTGGKIKNGVYPNIPFHWYITVYNLDNRVEIHNIDLHNPVNHDQVNNVQSIIKESYIGIGGLTNKLAIQKRFPCIKDIIAIINCTVNGWEPLLIKDILNYEVCREQV